MIGGRYYLATQSKSRLTVVLLYLEKTNQNEVLPALFGFHNFDGGGKNLSGTQLQIEGVLQLIKLKTYGLLCYTFPSE